MELTSPKLKNVLFPEETWKGQKASMKVGSEDISCLS